MRSNLSAVIAALCVVAVLEVSVIVFDPPELSALLTAIVPPTILISPVTECACPIVTSAVFVLLPIVRLSKVCPPVELKLYQIELTACPKLTAADCQVKSPEVFILGTDPLKARRSAVTKILLTLVAIGVPTFEPK